MVEMTKYEAGTPSWVDLMTTDPEAARTFYGELFGWEFGNDDPESSNYAMCRLRGMDVAGIVGSPAPEGMPTAWTTYMATDDSDTLAERITAEGGTLVMPPDDVADLGRLVVAKDSTDAVFGSWQAGRHIGAQLVNEPGTVIWNELVTSDLGVAQTFYSAAFGYEWEDYDTGEGGPPYRLLKVGDRTVGGAMEMTAASSPSTRCPQSPSSALPGVGLGGGTPGAREDLVQPGQRLLVQPDLQRAQRICELLHGAGTADGGGNSGLMQQPGQADVRRLLPQLVAERLVALDGLSALLQAVLDPV